MSYCSHVQKKICNDVKSKQTDNIFIHRHFISFISSPENEFHHYHTHFHSFNHPSTITTSPPHLFFYFIYTIKTTTTKSNQNNLYQFHPISYFFVFIRISLNFIFIHLSPNEHFQEGKREKEYKSLDK